VSDPVAVILRFNGDPDDLHKRFEQARASWIEAQGDDVSSPMFFAICKAKAGIVLLTSWETGEDHKAFSRGIRPHLEAAGVRRPEQHEHLPIAQLGWNPAAP
jgi:hypothetical protein